MSRCLYCDSRTHNFHSRTYDIESREWDLHRCSDCRALFLSPAPSAVELEASYSRDYYGEEEQKFDSWVGKARLYFSRQRLRCLARLLPPPAELLDVGCGSGEFLEHAKALGYNCSGIELESAAERLQRLEGIRFFLGDVGSLELAPDSYDGICLWHVFEHLPQAKATLQKLTTALRTQGYLALAVPNCESIQAKLFSGHWFHWDPPRHLFLLGREELIREVEALGYELVTERSYLFEYDPFGFQQSLLNYLCPKKRDHLYEGLKAGGNRNSPRFLLEKLYFYLSSPLAFALSVLESILKRGGTVELYFQKIE